MIGQSVHYSDLESLKEVVKSNFDEHNPKEYLQINVLPNGSNSLECLANNFELDRCLETLKECVKIGCEEGVQSQLKPTDEVKTHLDGKNFNNTVCGGVSTQSNKCLNRSGEINGCVEGDGKGTTFVATIDQENDRLNKSQKKVASTRNTYGNNGIISCCDNEQKDVSLKGSKVNGAVKSHKMNEKHILSVSVHGNDTMNQNESNLSRNINGVGMGTVPLNAVESKANRNCKVINGWALTNGCPNEVNGQSPNAIVKLKKQKHFIGNGKVPFKKSEAHIATKTCKNSKTNGVQLTKFQNFSNSIHHVEGNKESMKEDTLKHNGGRGILISNSGISIFKIEIQFGVMNTGFYFKHAFLLII